MATTWDSNFQDWEDNVYHNAAHHNSEQTAVKNELLARLDILNRFGGVESGMTPTEDDTNDEIDIAAGVAWVNGKQYAGGVSIALAGEAADDYYAYIDPDEANEADAYKIKTTVPAQDEVLLAKFTWNGSDTITNFLDTVQWGLLPGQFVYYSSAAISAATVFRVPLIYPICIRRPSCIVDTCGTGAGPTYIDIHTGAAGSTATIWGTASDRLTIAYDDTDGAVVQGGVPDQNYKCTAGQVLEIIVDAAATGATGLSVCVPFTYY